jgi:hypothetical protein
MRIVSHSLSGRRDGNQFQQLDSPLVGALRTLSAVKLDGLDQLAPYREGRIEACHRVLKHHRNLRTSYPAKPRKRQIQDLITAQHN